MGLIEPFPLQTVLNVKNTLFDIKEGEYARLNAIYREQVQRLELLRESEVIEMEKLHQLQLRPPLDFAAVERSLNYLQRLSGQIIMQTKHVAVAREQVERKREELLAIMQECKSLETLREGHEERMARERLRIEARVIDDLVVARYAREG